MLPRFSALIWIPVCAGIFGCLAGSPGRGVSTSEPDALLCQPDTARMMGLVKVLTRPELAGRGSGTKEALAAADTIASRFQRLGLSPAGDTGYRQEFNLTGDLRVGLPSCNIIGLLAGRGALRGRYIVVGAHYDHLGRVGDDSSTPGSVPTRGEYYPGANDNASGVAIMCELVRMATLARSAQEVDRACLFVAFGAEEIGLQGSAHFVNNLPVPRDSIDVMINLDSVGQLRENRLYVSGIGTSPSFASLVAEVNQDSLVLELSRSGWMGSDHVSFNTIGVPVLFLFTGAYPEYNRPEDDWPALNVAGLALTTAYAQRLLAELRTSEASFPYTLVVESQAPATAAQSGERKAWLGTIPDFTDNERGFKLAGVIDGSPAERSGLKKGDLLFSFGETPVANLVEFTSVLRSHQPGDEVRVEVMREGKRHAFSIVLGDRRDR